MWLLFSLLMTVFSVLGDKLIGPHMMALGDTKVHIVSSLDDDLESGFRTTHGSSIKFLLRYTNDVLCQNDTFRLPSAFGGTRLILKGGLSVELVLRIPISQDDWLRISHFRQIGNYSYSQVELKSHFQHAHAAFPFSGGQLSAERDGSQAAVCAPHPCSFLMFSLNPR
jgi:hypothetical protein